MSWSKAVPVSVRIPKEDLDKLRAMKISLGPYVREIVRELINNGGKLKSWKPKQSQ